MLTEFFLKGWLIGFAIAMPLGPIGLLCLNQCLLRGLWFGIAAGLGVAAADGVHGALAGFGVSYVSDFLLIYQNILQLIGAFFLFFLGLHTLISSPSVKENQNESYTLKKVFLTMFTLTLTNPMTLLCFAGAYVGLGICDTSYSTTDALLLTGGVFAGSAAWWIILSIGIEFLGNRLRGQWISWLPLISGSLILLFSLAAGAFSIQQIFL